MAFRDYEITERTPEHMYLAQIAQMVVAVSGGSKETRLDKYLLPIPEMWGLESDEEKLPELSVSQRTALSKAAWSARLRAMGANITKGQAGEKL